MISRESIVLLYGIESLVMINRTFHKTIQRRLFKGKALIIFDPRQSGKSTLVDFIEETNDSLHAYEFKWSPKAKSKIPSTFSLN